MRPITAALAAAERKTALAPRTTASIKPGFMRRISDNFRLSTSVDADTPQMYANAGSVIYAAWRGVDGKARLSIAGAGRLETGNSTQLDDGALPAAMRYGMGRSGSENLLYVYRAVSATGAWRLQRAA
ncbi:MAG TPA: hypothetical protein PKY60_15155, partial [Thermoflexales bacterium]|nr:hypothetical protein [Thermoflexales bacterium]